MGSVAERIAALTPAAANVKILTIDVERQRGKWEIEGRDPRGKTMNMVIDALTGAVLRLDRDN